MLTINTNLSSLIAQGSMKSSTNKLNQAIERMTTGFKINHAKDNAANYSISTNMTTKIGAYNVAEDNAAMGLDLISTAEGTLDQIEDKLQRLRALQEQASNGTYGEQSLKAINAEVNALVDEINRIYSTAEYNGINMFSGASAEAADLGMRAADPFGGLERVSEAATIEANKSYRIDDSADLIALQDFVNGGGNTTNVTFELTADIDMSGKAFRGIGNSDSKVFKGTFNGNGHVIKNLTIDTAESYVGLFGNINGATIDSVGIVNANIKGASYVGSLAGSASSSTVTNCYTTGVITGTSRSIGGLVGTASNSTSIVNCYATATVSSSGYSAGGLVGDASFNVVINNSFATGAVSSSESAGGLVGELTYSSSVNNCYATGNVNGVYAGGLVGRFDSGASLANSYATGTVVGTTLKGGVAGNNGSSASISNCYYNTGGCSQGVGNPGGSSPVTGFEGKTVTEIEAIYTPEAMGFTEANGWTMKNGVPLLSWQKEAQPPASGAGSGSAYSISLQIGIASDQASQISLNIGFSLTGVDDLRMIGLDLTTDYLTQIDDMLALVSEKQTHFGATSNRLESVLEEITIQRDNLVSSRSTIRDADIAEVSSHYIQQQILQQASATLLATANQSPSIALQLI